MIKGVSFDLWFTLIWGDDKLSEEYTRLRVYAIYKVLSRYNKSIKIEDIDKLFSYTAHFRMTTHPKTTIKYIVVAAGVDPDDRIVEETWRSYEESTYNLRPYVNEETYKLLRELKERGYKVGIVSNTSFSKENLEHIFNNIGLSDYIDVIISSATEEVKKPHPKIYHLLIERMGLKPEEIVHVGDKYIDDVVGAYLTGMHGVLYRGLWEKYKVYREFRDERLIEVCPRECYIIDRLPELMNIIEELDGI